MSRTKEVKQRVRTARGRTLSSTRWLERQLNDPYVHKAKAEGYRARSAYKLLEVDAKHQLLRPGRRVVDLGAAPGSWSQVCARRGLPVVALDLEPVAPLAGVMTLQGDFRDDATVERLRAALGGPVDLVLSDMAAFATGQRLVDRLKAEELAELVLAFTDDVLAAGGDCLIKLVKGAEPVARAQALTRFRQVGFVRPPATRKDSSETFLIAKDRLPAG
ncbi:MAG: RlmE family RNA methyltransferase [Geminicoccaceae bacterium]|nr:MAG: RlmE family RNA methyltransferase [Geminicoccaceae bacterium]